MKRITVLISILLIISIIPAYSQPGNLDLSFGEGGTVISPITIDREMAYDICVQSDGKILLGGLQGDFGNLNMFVARYNEDGTPDGSFGNNGTAIIEFGGVDSEAWAMAVQDDGKILLGGNTFNPSPLFDNFGLARLNPDGTLDDSFGLNGIRSVDVDMGWDNAYGMIIQDDGMIVLGGDGYANDRRNACAIRYSSDGFLDKGFGAGGVAVHPIGTEEDHTRDIALQADGKILLCGYIDDGVDDQSFIARLNTDGTLDNTFGNNGKATLDIGGNDDRLLAMYVLDNGKILAGGFTRNASDQNDYLLLRYLSDGTLDNTFGSNGIKMLNFNGVDIIGDLLVQADGKILLSGAGYTFELVRCLEDGSLDNGFGEDGRIVTAINTVCVGDGIALHDNETVILGGHSKSDGEFDLTMARYLLEDEGGIGEGTYIFHDVSVYPNPVYGNEFDLKYTLSENMEVSIDLLSVNGQIVDIILARQSRKATTHHEKLIIPGISAGIYLLRLSTSQGSSIIRLEVQ